MYYETIGVLFSHNLSQYDSWIREKETAGDALNTLSLPHAGGRRRAPPFMDVQLHIDRSPMPTLPSLSIDRENSPGFLSISKLQGLDC